VSPSATRLLAALAGVVVGGALLGLAFHGTPPAAVWMVLKRGDWGLPAAIVLVATVVFVGSKSARWRLLLGSPPDLGVARLARPVLAGLALNALIPHAGEFVRAAALQRGAGRVASAVLSSIVAERVFDLFAVLVLGAIALGSVGAGTELAAAIRLLAVVAGILAVLIVVALAFPAAIERVTRALARPLPKRIQDWVLAQKTAALAGLEPVRSPKTSAAVFGWSIVQWLAVAAAVHGCGEVVGLSIGVAPACLVVVGIVVAFLLPNAPGYAGSVQVAFLVTLKPLGTADEAALAASVVYQLLMVVPLIVGGLVCLKPALARR
jgi:glycosyltransferase 2 family protein